MVWWLLRQLGSDSPTVRDRAIEKLGNVGDYRAVQPLLALLPRSRNGLVEKALGNIGSRAAIGPLILKAVHAHESEESGAARAALDKITLEWRTSPEAKEVLPDLVKLLRRDSYVMTMLDEIQPGWEQSEPARRLVPVLLSDFCRAGCEEFGKGGDVRRVLEKIVADDRGIEAGIALLGTPVLHVEVLRMLAKWDPSLRSRPQVSVYLDRATEHLEGPGPLSPLDPPNPWFATFTILPDRRALPGLVMAVAKDWRALTALEAISPEWMRSEEARECVPQLIKGGYRSSFFIRRDGLELRNWAWTLGQIKDRRAISALLGTFASIERDHSCDHNGGRFWTSSSVDFYTPPERTQYWSGEDYLVWMNEALTAIDSDWTRDPEVASIIPDLVEVALFSNRVERLLDRIDPDWPSSDNVRSSAPALLTSYKKTLQLKTALHPEQRERLLDRIDAAWRQVQQ